MVAILGAQAQRVLIHVKRPRRRLRTMHDMHYHYLTLAFVRLEADPDALHCGDCARLPVRR